MKSLKVKHPGGFFAALPENVRGLLSGIASPRVYALGEEIFTEGERHPHLHVLESGAVRLEMYVPGRGRVPILSAGPGDVLAWSAVTSDGTMTASAVVTQAATGVAFHGETLQRLCEAEPAVGYHVMRQLSTALSRRLVATRLQLLDLFAEQWSAGRGAMEAE